MCGFVYFLTREKMVRSQIDLSLEQLKTRGPDYRGIEIIETEGRFHSFGHNRLSILDLSPESHQPFFSQDQTTVLVFNGEIYNFIEVRETLFELTKIPFKTTGDTEVFLRSYHWWGESFLDHLEGMYAFSLVDFKNKKILVGRDPFGEKPLVYFKKGDDLYFASQVKGFFPLKEFEKEIEPQGLVEFLQFQYSPGKQTLFKNCKRIGPGETRIFNFKGQTLARYQRHPLRVKKGAQKAFESPKTLSYSHWKKDLKAALFHSVEQRLRADVPVGIFLSGGIDSTLIAAIAKRVTTKPIRIFTIGFENPHFDESDQAVHISRELGFEHTVKILKPPDLLSSFDSFFGCFDEPFGDSSALALNLLSRSCQGKVKVVLSGDGGDELFLGYDRYRWLFKLNNFKKILPFGGFYFHHLVPILKTVAEFLSLSNPLKRALEALTFEKSSHLYGYLIQSLSQREIYHLTGLKCPVVQNPFFGSTLIKKASHFDLFRYLPGDILVKGDRSTMANGIEGRVPFLDSKVVELALMAPQSFLCRGGVQKNPLKELLAELLPSYPIHSKKKGFSLPLNEWLRGPLRKSLTRNFSTEFLENQGLFNPAPLQKMVNHYLEGKNQNWYKIWPLWVFQKWYEIHFKGESHFKRREKPLSRLSGSETI